MDPMIEQCVRAHELRIDWFRQFQRYLADNVQPRLDELDALKLVHENLLSEVEELRAELAKKKQRAGVPA